MYTVTRYSVDADCVNTEIIETDEELFIEIADSVLIYLQEDSYPEEYGNEELRKIIDIIKTKDWKKLLEPANDFLYKMGNGEYYEVLEGDLKFKKVKGSIDSILNRVEKVEKMLEL